VATRHNDSDVLQSQALTYPPAGAKNRSFIIAAPLRGETEDNQRAARAWKTVRARGVRQINPRPHQCLESHMVFELSRGECQAIQEIG
jgi:hypothetical protein